MKSTEATVNRHIARHAPKETLGFAWCRFPTTDGSTVKWRLYRRGQSGALHFEGFTVQPHHTSQQVAHSLRATCHRRRDRVDELDMGTMGVLP